MGSSELTEYYLVTLLELVLCSHLVDGGCWVEKKPLTSSWRIDLSEVGESYLAKLSKSHRKDVRRVQRDLSLVNTLTIA